MSQVPQAIDFLNEEHLLVVFIPYDDDTFASTSHECILVVSTPDGEWLFNRRTNKSHGNTPQLEGTRGRE